MYVPPPSILKVDADAIVTAKFAARVPPFSISSVDPVAPTDHAAVVVIVCVFWMTKFPSMNAAGADPPPALAEFQLDNVAGSPLAWE